MVGHACAASISIRLPEIAQSRKLLLTVGVRELLTINRYLLTITIRKADPYARYRAFRPRQSRCRHPVLWRADFRPLCDLAVQAAEAFAPLQRFEPQDPVQGRGRPDHARPG